MKITRKVMITRVKPIVNRRKDIPYLLAGLGRRKWVTREQMKRRYSSANPTA